MGGAQASVRGAQPPELPRNDGTGLRPADIDP